MKSQLKSPNYTVHLLGFYTWEGKKDKWEKKIKNFQWKGHEIKCN